MEILLKQINKATDERARKELLAQYNVLKSVK
jgi:hypothetical protein